MSTQMFKWEQITLPASGLSGASTPNNPMPAALVAISVPMRGVIRGITATHYNHASSGDGHFGLWLFNSLVAANAFCTATMASALSAALAEDTTNAIYKLLQPATGLVYGPLYWSSTAAVHGSFNPGTIAARNLEIHYQCADGERPPTECLRQLYAVAASSRSGSPAAIVEVGLTIEVP